MKKKNKGILIFVLLLVVGILAIGSAFAFFAYVREGDIINVITIQGLDVQIISGKDSINLDNAYPISDEDGLEGIPLVFQVTNHSNKTISYTVKIDSDTEKLKNCTLEDGTACLPLSITNLRFSHHLDDEDNYSEPMTLSEEGVVAETITISPGDTKEHSLLLWISSKSGNDIMGHYFFGKLILEGNAIS